MQLSVISKNEMAKFLDFRLTTTLLKKLQNIYTNNFIP